MSDQQSERQLREQQSERQLRERGLCQECHQLVRGGQLVRIPGAPIYSDYYICRACLDVVEDHVDLMIKEHKEAKHEEVKDVR